MAATMSSSEKKTRRGERNRALAENAALCLRPACHRPKKGEGKMPTYNILLMGASYGSLLASKLLFGGHSIHLVCLPAEAELINAEGFKVTLPVRGRKEPVLLESRKLPGRVTAGPATGGGPSKFALVG